MAQGLPCLSHTHIPVISHVLVCASCPNIIYFTSTSAARCLSETIGGKYVFCCGISRLWHLQYRAVVCFCSIGSLLFSIMAVPACRHQFMTTIISQSAAEGSMGECATTWGLKWDHLWRECDVKVCWRFNSLFKWPLNNHLVMYIICIICSPCAGKKSDLKGTVHSKIITVITSSLHAVGKLSEQQNSIAARLV